MSEMRHALLKAGVRRIYVDYLVELAQGQKATIVETFEGIMWQVAPAALPPPRRYENMVPMADRTKGV